MGRNAVNAFFAVLVGLLFASSTQAQPAFHSVRYTESSTAVANPERGYYLYNNLLQLSSDVGRRRAEGYALIWGKIPLDAYRQQPALPKAVLDSLRAGFATARHGGMKVIVRASYGSRGPGGDYTTYEDPAQAIIEGHIAQLAPIFAENADVIALFEAGFVGPWGEWHTTTIANDYARGRQVISHLLNHTPAERMIAVRYPYFKQQLFTGDGKDYERVDVTNAYSGTPVARIGHHNDCFLASETDYGTYERGGQTRAEETAYLAAETLYTLFGGETCNPHPLNDCQRALDELSTLHASYLNSAYHPKVLQKWSDQGCAEEISQRLGARLVLEESRAPRRVRAGETLDVEVALKNRGFAPLYNARGVEFALRNEESRALFTFVQDVDPRAWKPDQRHVLRGQLKLPTDMPTGSYALCLFLPDPSPRLRWDPRYAYRIANEDTWDAESGLNVLIKGIAVE